MRLKYLIALKACWYLMMKEKKNTVEGKVLIRTVHTRSVKSEGGLGFGAQNRWWRWKSSIYLAVLTPWSWGVDTVFRWYQEQSLQCLHLCYINTNLFCIFPTVTLAGVVLHGLFSSVTKHAAVQYSKTCGTWTSPDLHFCAEAIFVPGLNAGYLLWRLRVNAL